MKIARLIFLFFTTSLFISCIGEDLAGADLMVGDSIPEFVVTMNNGDVVTSKMLSEGVSCIVFFHTTCPDCQQLLPVLQQVYDEYSSAGVSFALISREEEDETISQYWQECGFTLPYSPQKDRNVYELFAQMRVPRVYLNKDGIIRSVFTDDPVPGYDDLKSALENL
ncbi:MAG: redoxin domain-containing protein [Bacteroidales bacterium]|nr:redoxin domain-containing protein [Bacteroidales bacterium]